jgi:hypothetical protein
MPKDYDPRFDIDRDEDHRGHDGKALVLNPSPELAPATFEPGSGRVMLGLNKTEPVCWAWKFLVTDHRVQEDYLVV